MPTGRALIWFVLILACIGAIIAAGYAVHPYPLWMHREWGPIENMQVLSWFLIMLLGLLMLRRKGHIRDRLNGFWLSAFGYMALFRELDTHVLFNSDALGIWAISFKPSWVMDPQVPLYVKAAWAVLILAGLASLTVPLLFIRTPLVKMLIRRDSPTVLFLVGVGLVGFGYLADDVLGRGLLLEVQPMQALEEILELFGILAIFWSTVLTYRWPLTVREQWLCHDRTSVITRSLLV